MSLNRTNLTHRSHRQQPATLLFDMDGTLLDLNFDNMIWLHKVPEIWALHHQCSLEEAKARLTVFYHSHHGTLNWYSSRFWQQQLGVDVLALQRQYQDYIRTRPHCFELLDVLQQHQIPCWLVTNADEATLALKLENIALRPYFKYIVSSETVGFPKEQPHFWRHLVTEYQLDITSTWLIDDNSDVLASAKRFGIARQFGVLKPDSDLPLQTFSPNVCTDQILHLTDVLNFLA